MRRPRPAVVVGLVGLVLAIGYGMVWLIDPFRGDWVPTCTDVAPRMQAELGGGWTVTDPDEYREESRHRTSSTCEMAFVTADQKYTGTVHLFTVGASDVEAARKDVNSYQCAGTETAAEPGHDYDAFRLCSSTSDTSALVSAWTAKNDRRVNARVDLNIREDPEAATTYAQDLSRLVADESLTMTESG